jgi:hypothetical protein
MDPDPGGPKTCGSGSRSGSPTLIIIISGAELVDWKSNRGYRLMAVDRGFFAFIDLQFGEWPALLLTFPKASPNNGGDICA